jgi:hypothetical protein
MKYYATAHILFLVAIAASSVPTGLAVARPGPASKLLQAKTRGSSEASSSTSTGLLVDNEGNLYSPHVTKKNTQRRAIFCLRGGGLCVDNEGNFFTPRDTSEIATPKNTLRDETASRKKTTSSVPPCPSSVLRGGSNVHTIGGLSVDIEGNLFATPGSAVLATPNSAALSLRGGELCVDNEGNLYTPRQVQKPKPQALASNRRVQSEGAHDTVLLTKNRLTKKSSATTSRGKTKKSPEQALAFIGYNNALMET